MYPRSQSFQITMGPQFTASAPGSFYSDSEKTLGIISWAGEKAIEMHKAGK